ncbi:hypothetical protein niasHS_003679 [Heterodera schachtii]|uniref:Uncharacterized protein n=1 Tax=Heterodera schachtii TaxID=97005 RepID=A0ABD2KH70_HETSC
MIEERPLIECAVIGPTNSGGAEKNASIFEFRTKGGCTVLKTLTELEQLFEHFRNLLPQGTEKMPKKKFLVPEQKLMEKRKNWAEALVTHLVAKHSENCDVQSLFGPLLAQSDDDHVILGPSEKKTVKPANFDYLKTVGQGSFGKVYMVRYHGDGKIYAMKVLGKEHIKRRKEEKHVMAERNVLLNNIDHPFLVSLHYSFQTRDKLYFVLDFLNGGELFFHLQKERSFAEPRARFYAAEVASALGYLHAKDIIYRDLKPENLLLDRNGHVVLTDFGLCKEHVKMRQTTSTFCGTPEYLAPEVIQKKPYDRTVDWWCLGCVLFEMLFGLPPFYSKNQNEMYHKTLTQPLCVPSSASTLVRKLLVEILHKDRSERLGAKSDFEEIRSHPFFAPIDWEKLLNKEVKAPFVPKVRAETDTLNIAREFTDIEPNPASLVPLQTFVNRETEFAGFTYNQKPNLHIN